MLINLKISVANNLDKFFESLDKSGLDLKSPREKRFSVRRTCERTPEYRKKMSESLKAHYADLALRGEAHRYNYVVSDETKRKMSEASKATYIRKLAEGTFPSLNNAKPIVKEIRRILSYTLNTLNNANQKNYLIL